MIFWHIEPHMTRKGWTTAYQLAKEAGLTKPAAARVLSGARLSRIDADILDALCKAFRVKPGALLEYVPDPE